MGIPNSWSMFLASLSTQNESLCSVDYSDHLVIVTLIMQVFVKAITFLCLPVSTKVLSLSANLMQASEQTGDILEMMPI